MTLGSAPPRRAPRLWPWITLAALGGACVAGAIGAFAGTFVDALLTPSAHLTPYAVHQSLSAGDYYVFEDRGTAVAPGFGVPGTLQPRDVSITSADGNALDVWSVPANETRTFGSTSFDSVLEFHVDTAGTYHVRIASPRGVPAWVAVAPTLGAVFADAVGWLWLGALGMLLAVAGLVMTIVQAVRRSSRRHDALAQPACPQGHAVGPTAQFCPRCGAPVVRSGAMTQAQR